MIPIVKKQVVSTSQDTILAILERSNRQAVPIRWSFLRTEGPTMEPPLAEIVHHHDARALDLYLLVLAQASGGAFDVTHPAGVWARALNLEGKSRKVAVSKILTRLEDYKLIKRDRVRRLAHLTLLREDGSGKAYTHPARDQEPAYLQLPHDYWLAEWHGQLSLPAKTALLIALSLPRDKDFYLPFESALKQFAISADTLGDGVRELLKQKLLGRRAMRSKAPLTDDGYKVEFRYRLQPPFHSHSSPQSSPTTASG